MKIHKLIIKVRESGEGEFETSLEIKGDTPVLSEAIAHEIMENDMGGVYLWTIIDNAISHLEMQEEDEVLEEEKMRVVN